MKKPYFIALFFIAARVFSQSITVDTLTYTVPELVNDVLIHSSCAQASNISWRTGTNFGLPTGIGYFQNTNPGFPMESGVILSTGSAASVVGPNDTLLSSGTPAWLGDTDLESALASYGIAMQSTNATVLQFDFVPLSPNFDFKFLFASEEYGGFQCQFSDAFAFLLTNMTTGTTTNLAVVPGTNTPISVVTIRDLLYNSNCPSANEAFFGTFNGGAAAMGSATNFNGQTKIINASATLVPGTPYRVKLVIADREDSNSDSAIFISSNSFNIGQDVLGSDLLVANNTALCKGANYTINSGLDPALYTFEWKYNGTVMAGQAGPSITINQPGTYQLAYASNTSPCQSTTNEIVIENYPVLSTPNPKNIYKCNTGQSSYTYNLGINTPIVTNGLPAGTAVNYYNTLTDANAGSNPVGLNYPSPGNTTIYVRINSAATGCFIVKSFKLLVAAAPVAHQPQEYKRCAGANGKANFPFNPVTVSVLGGQSTAIYSVKYYYSLTDATNGVNAITGSSVNSAGTTLYARVQLTDDPACFSITSFNLTAIPLPAVDDLPDVLTCNSYTLPALSNGKYYTGSGGTGSMLPSGTSITATQQIYIYSASSTTPACPNETSFNVTILDIAALTIPDAARCTSYTLPELPAGAYHTAPGGGGTIIPAGTTLTESQSVYAYFVSATAPFCTIDQKADITIIPSPSVVTLPDAYDCTAYVLPALAFGNYYDGPGGSGNLLPAGTTINENKTLYIYGTANTCSSESSFHVFIGSGSNFPAPVSACARYTLPALPIGQYYTGPGGTGTVVPAGTVVDTTTTFYVYVPAASQGNCPGDYSFTVTIALPVIIPPSDLEGCGNYILPPLAVGNYFTGQNGTGTMLNAGDAITQSQTLYVFINNSEGCDSELSLDITVHELPEINSRSTIYSCGAYKLTPLSAGHYYTGPGGTGTQLNAGTLLTESQLVYIYAIQDGCTAETSFQVNIAAIKAHHLDNVAQCDSYTLQPLPGNNKYYTQPGGLHGNGVELTAGTTITSNQTLYIYIESGERINCIDESSFDITIIQTPVVAAVPDVYSCSSYTLPPLVTGDYYTQPGKGGARLHAGDVITNSQALYVYAETGTQPNCHDEKSFTVTVYNVDDIENVTACDSYTLPSPKHGNYYHGPGGTGGLIAPGTTLFASQVVYLFGHPDFDPACSDEHSFSVTIVPVPTAHPVPLSARTFCDDDGTNDGLYILDLASLDQVVLGTQSGPEFNVSYFNSADDAAANLNPVVRSANTRLFARVSNTLAPDCFDVEAFDVIVNKLPEPTPQNGIVCISDKNGQLLKPYLIYSGLPAATHSFKWHDQQGQLVGTASNYQAVAPGVYDVVATSNTTGCSSVPKYVTVAQSGPALVTYEVGQDFSGHQRLTVIVTGTGIYEYQLDNGAYQESPVFENIASGLHLLSVRDTNGCGTTAVRLVAIGYPHFFTPNGDSFNDTWNIKDLQNQPASRIYILDRFGKLITEISPSGNGWDGTDGRLPLPADDYWFTVTYEKEGEITEFKSHFALKR